MMNHGIAYCSPDWNGVFEDGQIKDEGTRGFCIVQDGNVVIHEGCDVVIQGISESPVRVLFVSEMNSTGRIHLN